MSVLVVAEFSGSVTYFSVNITVQYWISFFVFRKFIFFLWFRNGMYGKRIVIILVVLKPSRKILL